MKTTEATCLSDELCHLKEEEKEKEIEEEEVVQIVIQV